MWKDRRERHWTGTKPREIKEFLRYLALMRLAVIHYRHD